VAAQQLTQDRLLARRSQMDPSSTTAMLASQKGKPDEGG
jgi:hypothetical protein